MFRHYLLNIGAAAGAILAMAAATAAPLGAQTAQPVPDELRVPAGNTAFLKAAAVGTQNYVCLPVAGGGGGLAWKFQGPQATLFLTFRWFNGAELRQQIATHYLSPNPDETGTPGRATWQSSADTSSTWAKKIGESSDAAYVAPGAIPWFLLQVAGRRNGPTGGNMLSPTTFLQRVNTTGGMMPSPPACSEAGSIQFVPYTADYIFYRAAN